MYKTTLDKTFDAFNTQMDSLKLAEGQLENAVLNLELGALYSLGATFLCELGIDIFEVIACLCNALITYPRQIPNSLIVQVCRIIYTFQIKTTCFDLSASGHTYCALRFLHFHI
jgi:hypothetical protein